MRKSLRYIIYFTSILFLSSCSEESINSIPENFPQASAISGKRLHVQQFINNLYTFIPRGYNRLNSNAEGNNSISGATPTAPNFNAYSAMVASATDEAVHATRNSAAEKWGTGQWGTASSNSWDGPISVLYTGIRRTLSYTDDLHPNLIIGTAAEEVTPELRDQFYGEALFIRALLNFELLKRYGAYPIVKKQLLVSENMDIPKSSYEECVAYIADLCDEAEVVLPFSYAGSDFGRATKGAALALKARLLLYAASPLNNPTSDLSKWKKAAEAAAVVINLRNGATKIYNLYTTGASGAAYENFFHTLAGNNEIIFSRIETANNTYERLNGLPSMSGGLSGTNPTLELVNAYEMIDGTPFDWNNPAHAANPFARRDPRFERTILFNGSDWMAVGTNTKVETFEGGKDKVGLVPTRTGFYLRKFLNRNARFAAPTGTAIHAFPVIRYAEILLNYAEAMNEAYGPDNPSTLGMTARQAVGLIRTRAGITDNINVPSVTDQELMRNAIRHERRIELAFEEHRHMDLRRWKTAEIVLNQPVSGLKITKTESGSFIYTPEVVEDRAFTEKMYRYPFPQEELSRNTALVQNTGW